MEHNLVGNARRDRLEELYQDAHGDLRRFLLAKLPNADDVDEVAQECYLRIFRYVKFMSVENSRAFLFTIATNLLTDRARQQSRLTKYQAQMGKPIYISSAEDAPSGQPSPESCAARKQELDLVFEAIEGLTPKCRQALVMQRFGGMSHQQIADVLNVSKSMVEKYIAQAMLHLHNALP
jgi:RNA polymerase sigma factor (sigma-70 family)